MAGKATQFAAAGHSLLGHLYSAGRVKVPGSCESEDCLSHPHVFRVAISNNRILKLEDGQVTFKYKESATDQIKFCTIPAEEFIRRFLQHVLPDRFIKLRYYGLLSPGNRELLNQARKSLCAEVVESNPTDKDMGEQLRTPVPCCPSCGTILTLIRELKPRSGLPP